MTQSVNNLEQNILLECILQRDYECTFVHKFVDDIDCKICTISMKDEPVIILPCKHIFHNDCMFTYILNFSGRKCAECSYSLDI